MENLTLKTLFQPPNVSSTCAQSVHPECQGLKCTFQLITFCSFIIYCFGNQNSVSSNQNMSVHVCMDIKVFEYLIARILKHVTQYSKEEIYKKNKNIKEHTVSVFLASPVLHPLIQNKPTSHQKSTPESFFTIKSLLEYATWQTKSIRTFPLFSFFFYTLKNFILDYRARICSMDTDTDTGFQKKQGHGHRRGHDKNI